MKAKRKRTTRNERRWREIEKITGPLGDLPPSFKHGLYHLRNRADLPDAEIVRAFQRCGAWLARAKNGIGECECGCGTQMAVEAVNARGQSVWCLDHDVHTRMFRGILHQACNREIASGIRERKWAHVNYVESCDARVRAEGSGVYAANEFLRVVD